AMSMLLLLANVSLFLAVLGRDDTLTGRTPLWSAVVHSIQERPLLGYGYAAFWMPKSPDSSDVISAVGWLSGHSHNGCLDVGLVGAFLFAAGFGVTFSRAISLFQKRSSSSEKWPLIFLIFYIVYNF